MEKKTMYRVHDAIGWDDRKELAEVWQSKAPLAELSDEVYFALIAVAQWGAYQLIDWEERA